MTKLSILGAGSWGSALAMLAAENEHNVTLWTHKTSHAQNMQTSRQNPDYLKQLVFPDSIKITSDLGEAVRDADVIAFVLPTRAIRQVATELAGLNGFTSRNHLPIIMHASKGLEQGSHYRISEVLLDVLGDIFPDKELPIVALSGPSHAEEVVNHDITAITAASSNLQAAQTIQDIFTNHYFRVYTNKDIVGVELGGALKNIIALGAGILAGLSYGDNAKAALITRGLAEITRLGRRMGADPMTYLGLSGVGDLVVTATSPHSRNWQAGYQIGQGKSPQAVEADMNMVVEGMATTLACYEIAQELEVDMPITRAIYQVIAQGQAVDQVINDLMQRDKKGEIYFAQSQIDQGFIHDKEY
ncbi:NAD(P)H-dependent glycerol-3-phosphate dehydrogenase [Aerococcus kribbianus]|uniref:Glycerol-3-phosphate dehydrogenase [NAD(P)+] n=1 Tax=Aerococcus kribbianus TaxID=2999064 RepID=A0A9X3JDH1_9LACT|nr:MULTISPECIES: NAD(P)H-dependent glycerol-3-phosphate dehydrogenase [unclassified Aerococcus]MCZ0717485.1 NAD(P)H-dependent glycerol-3-phosphate dehydrogenase [Aerococcus sp. YH-aer221]MCZ0725773.1 NAD(P)H-dependent glycerol-3-phosphate dehydrogenase [Aerococcus sp. YH-aer222]